MKAHCIVKSGLDVTGSVRCRTVEIGHLDDDGLSAALEVRSYGCNKDPELIFISGLNTDNGI